MKPIPFAVFFLVVSQSAIAQVDRSFFDTAYYTSRKELTIRDSAQLVRYPAVQDGDHYLVSYFSLDSLISFSGTYLPRKTKEGTTIDPIRAVKDGHFIYYRQIRYIKEGISESKKFQEGDYRKNVPIGTWSLYRRDGETLASQAVYDDFGRVKYQHFFDEKGWPESEGEIEDGKRNGQWKLFYHASNTTATAVYRQGILEGPFTILDDKTGKTLTKGQFSRNMRNGDWETFDLQTGQYDRTHWLNGLKDGAVFFRLSNGSTILGQFAQYKHTGTWLIRGADTNVILGQIVYDKKQIGKATYFDSASRDIVLRGNLKGDMRTGEWSRYHPGKNMVLQTIIYKEGRMHGYMQEFDTLGYQVMRAHFRDDLYDGVGEWNFPHSDKRWFKASFSKGELDGERVIFYRDGKIKRKDVFAQGILKSRKCFDVTGAVLSEQDCPEIQSKAAFAGDLMTFIGNNLRYPEEAKEKRIEGKVEVRVLIDIDGSVTDPVVVTSADPILDAEALRLVTSMPRWRPLQVDGYPMPQYKLIPIVFWLPEVKQEQDSPEEQEVAEGSN